MEPGKHFIKNQKRLETVTEGQWASALEKCRTHIAIRLRRRTTFGAHTSTRLGEDPHQYYLIYAYEAILSGRWEWKQDHTLSEQMIFIADSTISTEVEKVEAKKTKGSKPAVIYDDYIIQLYEQDEFPDELDLVQEAIISKQIGIIEQAINGDEDLINFWECIKEGFKRIDIAGFLEKTPKQVDKLRERFIDKIKNSPYFQLD